MIDFVWLAAGRAMLGFLAHRSGRIWVDAGRRGFRAARRLEWALVGAVIPSRYWWGARIDALSPQEQDELLARETAALGLRRADGLRCPLCTAEVPRAWALAPDGRPTVAPGPIECPRCDFRLDVCRHCAHFLPGGLRAWGQLDLGGGDFTFGRCDRRRVPQPVEEACTPSAARQLKARGWDQVRAPLPIVDSFVPPDDCTAFTPDHKRLQAGGVRWPDARRTALLRLLAPPPVPEMESPKGLPTGDDQWLL